MSSLSDSDACDTADTGDTGNITSDTGLLVSLAEDDGLLVGLNVETPLRNCAIEQCQVPQYRYRRLPIC